MQAARTTIATDPCFPEKTALAAAFLLGFLVDWVRVGVCFVPSTPKGCERPGKRVPKKQREGLNVKQGAERGGRMEQKQGERRFLRDLRVPGDAAGCRTWMAPRAASAKCKRIPRRARGALKAKPHQDPAKESFLHPCLGGKGFPLLSSTLQGGDGSCNSCNTLEFPLLKAFCAFSRVVLRRLLGKDHIIIHLPAICLAALVPQTSPSAL